MVLALLVQLDGESTSSCHASLGAPAPRPAQTPCQHPSSLCGIPCPELLQGSGLQLHRDFGSGQAGNKTTSALQTLEGLSMSLQRGRGWFAKPTLSPSPLRTSVLRMISTSPESVSFGERFSLGSKNIPSLFTKIWQYTELKKNKS